MSPVTREQLLADLVAHLDAAMTFHSQGRHQAAESALVSANDLAENLGLPRRGQSLLF
jgi:hypothetical protein